MKNPDAKYFFSFPILFISFAAMAEHYLDYHFSYKNEIATTKRVTTVSLTFIKTLFLFFDY